MNDYQNIIINSGRLDKSYNHHLKYKYKDDYYYEETFSPMRKTKGKRVEINFGDRTKPLFRFLESSVGKKWDNVYSELCKNFDKRSLRSWHLFSHIDFYMVPSVEKKDGKYYHASPFSWYWKKEEIRHYQFFVDENGYLRQGKKTDTKRERLNARIKQKEEKKEYYIDIESGYLEKIDGIWFYFEELSKEEELKAREKYNKTYHNKFGVLPNYIQYTKYKKTQLSKKELKRLNLKND